TRDAAPEIPTHRQGSEVHSVPLHLPQVKTGMQLFVFEGLENTPPKGSGGVREFQQYQSHQLSREELVIGKKMQQSSPFRLLFDPVQSGKIPVYGGLSFELEV